MSSKALCEGRTFLLFGQIPERSNGGDCKSLGLAFGGSNPSLPTIMFYAQVVELIDVRSHTPERSEWGARVACRHQLIENHITWIIVYAQVVELVDTLVLETSAFGVEVRVFSWAPKSLKRDYTQKIMLNWRHIQSARYNTLSDLL